jgi:feruloyl-CoA synthase
MGKVIRDPDQLFATPRVTLDFAPDGSMRLRSQEALGDYARCIGVHLEYWATKAANRELLVERADNGEWVSITYHETYERVRRIAANLLRRGLSAQRPVVILSENSIDHALLMLAAMQIGSPSVSVSVAYSLISTDFQKLRKIVSLIEPGLIYVSDAARYAAALASIQELHNGIVVFGHGANASSGGLPFAALEADGDVLAVDTAYAAIVPETIAKVLFTSGSTDEPKGVIITQRMLTANQQARAQVWPFLNTHAPVVVDWLPWSHTFGGNHNFNLVLRFGGTMYIDGGRPGPSFADTIANLRSVSPTIYFNVPRGYDMLVSALKSDADLRKRFFRRMQLMFYAAAALPQHLWDALGELAHRSVGESVPLVSAWGSTETAPLVTDCHFVALRSGVIGVPVPGCELKLVGNAGRLEARVRGPNVTPGYWKRTDLTASHFDDEGFYKIGDAVQFVDHNDPTRGLYFDGRVAEDFKLDSGTWVNTGMLRIRAIAALAPIAADIVITGHDRPELGLLIFPNVDECRRLCGSSSAGPVDQLLLHPQIRSHVAAGLASLRADGGGTSSYATRALLVSAPPSLDAGEITDKGYINQRAVLARRATCLARLHETDAEGVIRIAPS